MAAADSSRVASNIQGCIGNREWALADLQTARRSLPHTYLHKNCVTRVKLVGHDSALGSTYSAYVCVLGVPFVGGFHGVVSEMESLGEIRRSATCRHHCAKITMTHGETCQRSHRCTCRGKYLPRNLYPTRPEAWRGLRGDPEMGGKYGVRGLWLILPTFHVVSHH
jgi:hypothetical protein